MKKFAFYVSGNATRLKKFLLKYENKELIKCIEFILIDNIENKELKKICMNLDIKFYEIHIKDKKNKNYFISNLFLQYLENNKVDYAFIFADRILVGKLLQKFENKLINFHPSILPSHKGLYAIDQALKENTFLLGNSAHIITDELDSGNVIMQNIFPSVNFTKYDDVLDQQLIMILQLMHWINSNRLKIDNGKALIANASYSVNEFIPNIEIEKNQ